MGKDRFSTPHRFLCQPLRLRRPFHWPSLLLRHPRKGRRRMQSTNLSFPVLLVFLTVLNATRAFSPSASSSRCCTRHPQCPSREESAAGLSSASSVGIPTADGQTISFIRLTRTPLWGHSQSSTLVLFIHHCSCVPSVAQQVTCPTFVILSILLQLYGSVRQERKREYQSLWSRNPYPPTESIPAASLSL